MSGKKELVEADVIDGLKGLSGFLRGATLSDADKKSIADFLHACWGNNSINILIYYKKQDYVSEHKVDSCQQNKQKALNPYKPSKIYEPSLTDQLNYWN